MTAHIRLRYTYSLNPDEWVLRHARGEVPDHLPYGLHRLGGPSRSLDVATAPRGVRGVASRVMRASTGGYELVPLRRAGGADVELAWDEGVGIPTALTARSDVAVATGVIWLTDRRPKPGLRLSLERRALQRCSAVWALSSAQLPLLQSVWGVQPDRLHHLQFGVDRDFWSPSPSMAIPGRVLVVGNDRDRDHGTAVQGAERARAHRAEVHLHLVSRLAVDVPPELGVRSVALGHAELREEYRRAAVCVVAVRPNRHVSGITAALEAMACERPVVVTDTPGMSDYVADGVNGLLVPPGDADAVASAILKVLSNPNLAADLGEAGRRAVEESFNTERQAEQLAAILDRS
ncbi:glycosyltransferase family 4 protein [Geodermatophilus sp. SYSU D00691]